MSIEDVLERMGGVATRAGLVQATSRREVDEALRTDAIIRVAHGRYALKDADAAKTIAHALSGVLCLESAAVHWGWAVKSVPTLPQVAVRPSRKVRTSRAELRRLRLTEGEIDSGVTTRERTLVDCLRLLPFDRALAVADSALRDGYSRRWLESLVRDARGPQVARMRRIAMLATEEAANPFESVLRAIVLGVSGIDVRPQVSLRRRRADGGTDLLGRPDLVDEVLRIVLEADSFEWHGSRAQLDADAKRYNSFVVEGWLVLRFSWETVMFDPDLVRKVVEAAVIERTDRLCPGCRAAS